MGHVALSTLRAKHARLTPLDASYKPTPSLVLRDLDSVFVDSPRNGCLRLEAANALRNASAVLATFCVQVPIPSLRRKRHAAYALFAFKNFVVVGCDRPCAKLREN
jgi:hypothetical protein